MVILEICTFEVVYPLEIIKKYLNTNEMSNKVYKFLDIQSSRAAHH